MLEVKNLQNCSSAVLDLWNCFRKTGNAFAGKEKTGADGRDRSLSLQRGSFAYYRKVPMVVKAAGESTGGEQLASSGQAVGKGRQAVGKRWLKA
ncbi:MAG: hypothetical protein PHQ11_15195, partial [Paludibacter sp.]|nr:hypothetical protein [Paludibacter sp.]